VYAGAKGQLAYASFGELEDCHGKHSPEHSF
jgi:hypothetical protein